MNRLTLILLAGTLAARPAVLIAQSAVAPVKLNESKPGMLAMAKIQDSTARQSALAKVPGGIITEAELESEHGRLIYSYDVKVAGKSGIQEVAVDARTGKVLSVEHESAEDEAREAGADSAARKKP